MSIATSEVEYETLVLTDVIGRSWGWRMPRDQWLDTLVTQRAPYGLITRDTWGIYLPELRRTNPEAVLTGILRGFLRGTGGHLVHPERSWRLRFVGVSPPGLDDVGVSSILRCEVEGVPGDPPIGGHHDPLRGRVALTPSQCAQQEAPEWRWDIA